MEVEKEKLQPGRIAQATVFYIPSAWALKVRVDDNNQLGLYFCNKTGTSEDQSKPHDGVRRGRQFFCFSTGIYNFQIEDNPRVYESCGIFGFPKSWNYLYGPSKLADAGVLKQAVEGPNLHIRCWLYEAMLHSAILHHIATSLDHLLTADDMQLLPVKDVYSLLESEDLHVTSEDQVLSFLSQYVQYHSEDNLVDILKAVRLNHVSTESLLSTLRSSAFRENPAFVTRIIGEMDFRSKLSICHLLGRFLARNFRPAENSPEFNVEASESAQPQGSSQASASTGTGPVLSQRQQPGEEMARDSERRARLFDTQLVNPDKFIEGVLNFILTNDVVHRVNSALANVSFKDPILIW